MAMSREILDRVDRVLEYHQASKRADGSLPLLRGLDWTQPPAASAFAGLPRTALPTALLDAPSPTLSLLRDGLQALPPTQAHAPQDLKTLASWLYMADGFTERSGGAGAAARWLRSVVSCGETYPCEIYVAAFAINQLDPGLYYFDPKDFSLARLRGGPETLAVIKRGRPDLEMLKSVPAALLVSTIFCRSSWRFGRRGYRTAVLDAGQLVQNLATTATGLGIQTLVRLRMNDANARELIGVSADTDYANAEAVHAMLIWADTAKDPMVQMAAGTATAPMEPIEREALADDVRPFAQIVAVHDDCVAPGVTMRDVKPPLTEMSVLAEGTGEALRGAASGTSTGGEALRKVLLSSPLARDFAPRGISLDQLWTISRLAFRGGSSFPLFPDGPHVALIRPFWFAHDVDGMEAGIWYYRPQSDGWTRYKPGVYRMEAQHLAMEETAYGRAAAVCVLCANVHRLVAEGGPDLYRLALLEAGQIAQRIHLSACAMGLATTVTGDFYEESARALLGVEKTGWEPLHIVAVGVGAATRTATW